MESNEGSELLTGLFFEKDWFCEVGVDTSNRYIVYVKYMNMDTMTTIPDQMLGKQVLVHFISSKPVPAPPKLTLVPPFKEDAHDAFPTDVSFLANELDRLEHICDSRVMQHIFYEIHDGKNAVTDLSERFASVRESMERLYNEYGFDVLYEELDE